MSGDENLLKLAAAESAIAQVTDGLIVGLGSGSTAAFAVDALGRRVQQGLRIVGVPTSEQTAAQARSLGIPLSNLEDHPQVDITIDGADEVEQEHLNLIKGRGGAQLWEKMIATSSKKLVIIVHSDKLVSRLGVKEPVPVEIVPFGWQATAKRLSRLGAKPLLRRNPDAPPYRTDGGNYIVDCAFGTIDSAVSLAREIDHVVGVVEHALFVGFTPQAHVAAVGGVRIVR